MKKQGLSETEIISYLQNKGVSYRELSDALAQSKIGHEFTVTSQDSSSSLAPGQFYAIDLGKGGGSDYRNNIANCAVTYVRCFDSYSVSPGKKDGPTQQGVNDLLGNPPTDRWVSVGQ